MRWSMAFFRVRQDGPVLSGQEVSVAAILRGWQLANADVVLGAFVEEVGSSHTGVRTACAIQGQ
jgi:hypothetical protein